MRNGYGLAAVSRLLRFLNPHAFMLRRLSAAFICAVLLAGCSQTSFLGRHVQNFTAYYNTFYNARQSFDEGIRNIERAPLTIDESRFLPDYPPAPERSAERRVGTESRSGS